MHGPEVSKAVYAAAMMCVLSAVIAMFGVVRLSGKMAKSEQEFADLKSEVINFHNAIREGRDDARRRNDARFQRLEEHTGVTLPGDDAAADEC